MTEAHPLDRYKHICESLWRHSERLSNGDLIEWFTCEHGGYGSLALAKAVHKNETVQT